MKIGIIGSGEIGGTLTRRLTALGHEVSVANSRGPKSLVDLAVETGAKPVSVAEAARSGEVVVVTIPEKSIQNLPSDLFGATPAEAARFNSVRICSRITRATCVAVGSPVLFSETSRYASSRDSGSIRSV